MEQSRHTDSVGNEFYGINKYSFTTQFLIWFGIFFGCFMFAQLISGAIIFGYYKNADINVISKNTADLNVLRIAQIIATLCSFLLPALIFSKRKINNFFEYSNATIRIKPVYVVLVPLLLITIYPTINVSYFINKVMPWHNWMAGAQVEYKTIITALLKDKSDLVLILNLFTVAIFPAICEEWLFRGTLQKLFTEKLNVHLAVFLSSVLFSLIHMEFSGFLPRIVLGMFLGYLFYYTQSLWISIFAHFLNNGTQLILMYLYNVGVYKTNVDEPIMPPIWEWVVYSLGFILLCIVFIYFVKKNKNTNFEYPKTSN